MNDPGSEFASLLEAIRRVFPATTFEVVSEPELAAIKRDYPDVPGHYLEFLRHVGYGSLGPGDFMVYNGLVSAYEIVDPVTAPGLEGILFFGDDFSGWVVGFDPSDGWRIVGVEHTERIPHSEEARTLAEFIAERVADQEGDPS